MGRLSGFITLLIFSVHVSGQMSLEHLLSAPYSSDLVKSADGNVLAWVTNTKGIRSLHSYKMSQDSTFTHFISQGDDGQIIGGLDLGLKGEWLYFVTGSNRNNAGESANPNSANVFPAQMLYRAHTSSNQLDTLGPHSRFIVSNQGDYLLLPKGNQLLKMEPPSKATKEIIRMRGVFGNVEIAPDGTNIIFESHRGDHSFIGQFSFGSGRISWLSPGVDLDTEPQYSSDGLQVAFIRTPGHKKDHLNDITSGTFFHIMVHNIASGSLDTIWTSPNDAGGFAQYYHEKPLRWAQNGKLVFYSEHEGHMKIYSVNSDGSGLRSLLKDRCEIEHSDLSVDGKSIIFSANAGDTDRRDLFEVDLASSDITFRTKTNDIETNPLSLSENQFAFLKGSSALPTAVWISGENETQISMSVNSGFPEKNLLAPTQVVYLAPDGERIHGQLFDNGLGTNKPAIIFMHGGPIRQMLMGYHYSGYYANAYAFNQYMASKGYVVFSVNYRSGIGYGRDFRRAPNQGPRGASEYQDIVAAGIYLQSLYQVDSARIGLWGGSYGGFLTAMGLARNSDIFKAGVDLHGVHDWAWRAKDFSKGGFWGIDEDAMEEAWNSSPVASIDGWASPVLFIHGDDDRNVMFGQTVDLVQRLRKKSVPHEILVLPDEVHGFYRWESWFKSFQKAADFFDRKL